METQEKPRLANLCASRRSQRACHAGGASDGDERGNRKFRPSERAAIRGDSGPQQDCIESVLI